MKKKILAVFISTVIIFGFTGCLGDSRTGGYDLYIGVDNTTSEYQIMMNLVNAYTAKNPDVKIDVQRMPGDYNRAVVENYIAGTLPDIIYTKDDTAAYFSAEGVFEQLDSYIERDSLDLNIYYESILNIARPLMDNKMYFMPRDYNKVTTFINVDMFNAAGIDIPSDDWTWDDFLDICNQFRVKMDENYNTSAGLSTHSYPIYANVGWKAVYYPVIKGFDGQIFNQNGSFALTENSQGILELKALVDNRYEIDPNNANYDIFLSGQAAMRFGSRPTVSSCIQNGIKVDFVAFPELPHPVVGMGCTGYAVTKKSNNKELAWDFLKFVISEEGQTAFSQTGDCVPMIIDMKNDTEWRSKPSPILNHDAFIKFPERDLITNYMPMISPSNHMSIYRKVDMMMKDLFAGYAGQGSLAGLMSYYADEINYLLG